MRGSAAKRLLLHWANFRPEPRSLKRNLVLRSPKEHVGTDKVRPKEAKSAQIRDKSLEETAQIQPTGQTIEQSLKEAQRTSKRAPGTGRIPKRSTKNPQKTRTDKQKPRPRPIITTAADAALPHLLALSNGAQRNVKEWKRT